MLFVGENYGFFAPLPFRPLARSPPGSFATWCFHPMAFLPPGSLVFRPLADSPSYPGRFAPLVE